MIKKATTKDVFRWIQEANMYDLLGVLSSISTKLSIDYLVAIDKPKKDDVYTKESMQTDIDWLGGYDIDKKEARKFIKSLLKKRYDGN